MKVEILIDADAVAQKGAEIIAAEARAAVAERGHFIMAVSGGRTPWKMLRALASEKLPWEDVRVVQVDERVAPAGDADRNLTHLRESLLEHTPLRPEQILAMPVESPHLNAAAARYATTLKDVAGSFARSSLVAFVCPFKVHTDRGNGVAHPPGPVGAYLPFIRSIKICAVSGRMIRESGSSPARSFSRRSRPLIETVW